MRRSILVSLSLAILAASTSAGLAARRHHHHQVVGPTVGASGNPAMGAGGSDYAQHMQNLRDSGYDPKKDFTATGTVRTQ